MPIFIVILITYHFDSDFSRILGRYQSNFNDFCIVNLDLYILVSLIFYQQNYKGDIYLKILHLGMPNKLKCYRYVYLMFN